MVNTQNNSRIRQKVISDYFLEASQYHRAWLYKLVQWYKGRGEFPLLPLLLLPSYYNNKKDKELAAFAALLLSNNEMVLEQVSDMRRIITDNPTKWLRQRGFVELSLGVNQKRRVEGNRYCEYWKIARLMDFLYNIPGGDVERYFAIRGFGELRPSLCSLRMGIDENKIRLFLAVLATSDGIGQRVWDSCPLEIKSPVTGDVCRCLAAWFPNYRKYGTIDEAISLFGFEKDLDFWYAASAYRELSKLRPSECRAFELRQKKWYDSGVVRGARDWNNILPTIPSN